MSGTSGNTPQSLSATAPLSLVQSPPLSPQSPPLSPSLTPVQVGRDLSRALLLILALTIILVALPFTRLEMQRGDDLHALYDVIGSLSARCDDCGGQGAGAAATLLRQALVRGSAPLLPAGEALLVTTSFDQLAADPAAPDGDRARVSGCKTLLLAREAAQSGAVQDCLGLLDRQAARHRQQSADAARAALELVKQLGATQKEQRDGWIEFTKTLVLNLLLPLLTAVFGYTFGRDSGRRSSPNDS